jgi:uncharacterized protein
VHAVSSDWSPPTACERFAILQATRSVAIIGMSADPGRPSYIVASYLISARCSFDHVWFVNPRGGEVLGRPVHPSLAEVPGVPDLVDVFRRTEALPDVAREVVARPGVKTFWAQLGLHSDEAVGIVTAAGLDAVTDRCLKTEHARFASGLHPAGSDTATAPPRGPVAL